MLLELQRKAAGKVYGADFCHPMLMGAKTKAAGNPLFEADALRLPLGGRLRWMPSRSRSGFAILANYRVGLIELRRVLKPGGTLAILEFSHPPGTLMKVGYGFYLYVALPVVGGLVSGSCQGYSYLPESIRKFPKAAALKVMMTEAGFRKVRFSLTDWRHCGFAFGYGVGHADAPLAWPRMSSRKFRLRTRRSR